MMSLEQYVVHDAVGRLHTQYVTNTLNFPKYFPGNSMTLANIRYKDNTKIVLKAIKFPNVNWIYVVPDVAQWTLCKHGNGIRLLYKEGNIIVCEI